MMPQVFMAVLMWGFPAFGGVVTADWQVYQQGEALELSINRNTVWREQDNLIHFVNQERFAKQQFDKEHQVSFSIRRTEGYANCSKYKYVMVSVDFYTASNRHVWSTLHPVPRHSWVWKSVPADSIAEAMIQLVCDIASTRPIAARSKAK